MRATPKQLWIYKQTATLDIYIYIYAKPSLLLALPKDVLEEARACISGGWE
jgi:hypothetical protein